MKQTLITTALALGLVPLSTPYLRQRLHRQQTWTLALFERHAVLP